MAKANDVEIRLADGVTVGPGTKVYQSGVFEERIVIEPLSQWSPWIKCEGDRILLQHLLYSTRDAAIDAEIRDAEEGAAKAEKAARGYRAEVNRLRALKSPAVTA